METPRSLLQKFQRIWAMVGSIVLVLFVGWALIAYRATAEAKRALVSDEVVTVVRGDGFWSFAAPHVEQVADLGILFFPGALVDPAAYAPITRAAAEAGFPAILVEVPRRAVLGGADGPQVIDRAVKGMRSVSGVVKWVIAGHSRGGAIASRFLNERSWRAAGLILIGTSHPRDFSLAHVTVPTWKILGSLDGISPIEKSEANRHLLPRTCKWFVLPGGNHSQFGWYGFQPGDRFATIERAVQQGVTIEFVIKALQLAEHGRPSEPFHRVPADAANPRDV